MIHKDDWRLKRQRKYIVGITLEWTPFVPYRPDMDSDHCEFCWAKFAVKPGPDVLTAGYSVENHYYWICPYCFDDFREHFGWTLKGPDRPPD